MDSPVFRTFAFEPPQWRTSGRTNLRTGVLFIGTILWMPAYLWAGDRLLRGRWQLQAAETRLVLIALTVAGILLVAGWSFVIPRWRLRLLHWRNRTGRRALSLAALQSMSPSDFESYVAARIFARQGYRVENTPDTKDGGVDILVTDPDGAQAIVQCKRYSGTVGVAAIRDLYGTMTHRGTSHGYLVTTGRISSDARAWAADKEIGLIDGRRLVALAKAEPHPRSTTYLRKLSETDASL